MCVCVCGKGEKRDANSAEKEILLCEKCHIFIGFYGAKLYDVSYGS